MKSGMTLTAMATELERQMKTKKDFVAPTAAIEMLPDTRIALKGTGEFQATDYTHGQIASYTGIPKTYYDRLRTEAPALLSTNVNRWMHDQAVSQDRRMLRTLDGNARAFLSNKYRPLDNFDLAEAVLPILMDQGAGLRVESTALTDTRMYIKAVTERLTMEIKKGDVVQMGLSISNSEVGAGMVKIEPFILRLICTNGAMAADASLKKYHVGRGHGGSEGVDVSEYFRDSTRRLDDQAFFAKVQDIIRAAFSEDLFKRLVAKMQATTEQPITGDPVQVVEVTAERYGLSDTERGSVLRNLIKGGDMSQYGLLNAITASAQDEALSYERATDLERLGGQIIELKPSDWKAIGAAA